MAIGQMVDDLPYSPSAGTIGSVELSGSESLHGGAQASRSFVDIGKILRLLFFGTDSLEFSSGITKIIHDLLHK